MSASAPAGSKGKAASLLVVGAGREAGEDDRSLDRTDRDEQRDEARHEARGSVHRNFPMDRFSPFYGSIEDVMTPGGCG
jgi:hypothetical protein